jgi:hypothetical protein
MEKKRLEEAYKKPGFVPCKFVFFPEKSPGTCIIPLKRTKKKPSVHNAINTTEATMTGNGFMLETSLAEIFMSTLNWRFAV